MRRVVGPLLACPLAVAVVFSTANAAGKNRIELENERPVERAKDSWLPELDPTTYEAKKIGCNGIVDVYPSSWSVKNGDTLGLRVSTAAPTFRTRIYRLGWYGNSADGPVGSRLVHEVASTKGAVQPLPPENDQTGLAEPGWRDSLTVAIPDDWITGQYVVRVTTPDGYDAYTHFALRDDTKDKAPILYVDTLFTEVAYDPWPKVVDATGVQLRGKSTYSYNSAGVDVKASGAKQAVEVSIDRPRGENWGLGIFRDWTVPTVQFLEKYGFDVAYANSLDVHVGHVLGGRKMWMDSGHDEYWTRAAWDNLEAARDAGLNLAFFSGNDFTWQVRLEQGAAGRKMVAYKIAAYPDSGRCGSCWEWGGDPEYQKALAAKRAGDDDAWIAHLKNVTYAWAGLKDWDPDAPSPVFGGAHKGAALKPPVQVSRLAISFEGLMNGPKLPYCRPDAAPDDTCRGIRWIVDHADHWVYTGAGVAGGVATGLADGDAIPSIVGYEMDNARLDRTYKSRPETQVVLAHTDASFKPEKGSAVDFAGLFNAQYYQHENGVHVFAAGTINWFWGVEREGMGPWGGVPLKALVKPGLTVDQAVTGITLNVLRKLQEGAGTPPTIYPDAGNQGSSSEQLEEPSVGCGCRTAGTARKSALVAFALAIFLTAARHGRRRR